MNDDEVPKEDDNVHCESRSGLTKREVDMMPS